MFTDSVVPSACKLKKLTRDKASTRERCWSRATNSKVAQAWLFPDLGQLHAFLLTHIPTALFQSSRDVTYTL